MKYATAVLIASVTFVWPALADEASKLAKSEELLQLVQGDQLMKMMEPMTKGMMATVKADITQEQRAKIADMQQKIMALVTDRYIKARPAFAKIYSDTYTEEELDGILAFYHSPAGKAFLQKMPEVMQRSAPVMMVLIGGLQPEIKKITDEMKQEPK